MHPARHVVAWLTGFREDTAPAWVVPCTNGWKGTPPDSLFDDLAPVIYVATDGMQPLTPS